ncbi:branched-chain amino acid transport system II carrier protein [Xanthomarina sp. F2636L]|uniref:branched-chain amino acid transport system II carrier protein n=1 Tax=Xanthomarina sp. F2636L TaxID=2996018 RepID=UPI00225E5349|nr:branched-chain amino acid transport system II carrier protein [Xanthomarina sp. F2636L]MCX7551079.1 branched-chain amino acid transport system II carrier protein [Xanthomarina sp. F2636L]
MSKTKEVFITAFALFSLLFGAGNLILPPYLGFKSGEYWILVAIGFSITAVFIPVLGVFAHAKLQGTMYDFGKKVSPLFSSIYCFVVYLIAISLPGPRTASVTHEMAIAPFFNSNALLTSTIYFLLVFVFVMNRSKILDIIGKFLTPLIGVILLSIIGVGLVTSPFEVSKTIVTSPFSEGILEGYQTFDAIGAVVVGAVIVISLNLKKNKTFEEKKDLITKSGWLAGFGLIVIYAGLILSGSLFQSEFSFDTSRTDVLIGLSNLTLGHVGSVFLSVLIALACFTTAVGVVTGTSDYIKGLFKGSQTAYLLTAVLGCIIGVVVGSYNVGFIIDIALPALMFIYPITIVLIILNVLPEKYASILVFRAVVLITFLFSISDFLKYLVPLDDVEYLIGLIPLAKYSLAWVLPAIITFVLINIIRKKLK